jgi:hypothetical protein
MLLDVSDFEDLDLEDLAPWLADAARRAVPQSPAIGGAGGPQAFLDPRGNLAPFV